jgi:hypothetical protein
LQAIDTQLVKPFVDKLLQTVVQAEQALGQAFGQDPWALPMGPRTNPLNNVMPNIDNGGASSRYR